MSDNDDEIEFTPEVVQKIIRESFGISADEFGRLTFEDRVTLMLASGRPYACTENIAPKDQDGNPITESGETSPIRH